MAIKEIITANCENGQLSKSKIARQWDNQGTLIQFAGYPEPDTDEQLIFRLIVWMRASEDTDPVELPPIELEADQWLISNYYTQLPQMLRFQLCITNGDETYEKLSPIFSGVVDKSLSHDGEEAEIDVIPLFDPYKKYVDELVVDAGARVVDTELDETSDHLVENQAVAKAVADVNGRLTDISDDLSVLFGHEYTIIYANGIALGRWLAELSYEGTANTTYCFRLKSVSAEPSSRIGEIDVYLMHSDKTFQTITTDYVLGSTIVFTATADFVKVRARIQLLDLPVDYIECTENFDEYSDCKFVKALDDISDLEDRVQLMEDGFTYVLKRTKTWTSATSIEFPVDGKANQKFYFGIDSISDPNTTASAVYFMKSDGTYFTASGNMPLCEEVSYTPSGDFTSIRFYLRYASAPADNVVSVHYGTKSIKYNFDDVYSEFDSIEADYISGICAPCAIGDSLTAGLGYSGDPNLSNLVKRQWSWATQLFEKENGTDVNIIAKSGATAKSILGEFATELSQITACDCVCVYLGTNQDKDGNNDPYPIGDVSDIVENWDDTPTDTFIGWYSKLLKTVSHYNNQYAFGICFGLIKTSMKARTDAIQLICDNIDGWIFQPIYKYSYLLDRLTNNDDGTHWTPIGYAGYKSVFKKAINEAIYNNPTIINKTANVFKT
jgi:hypothetical protein